MTSFDEQLHEFEIAAFPSRLVRNIREFRKDCNNDSSFVNRANYRVEVDIQDIVETIERVIED